MKPWPRPNYRHVPARETAAMNKPAKCPMRGLGDAVALIAEPIAAAMDHVAGTRLKGCSGCAKRREFLNQKVPFPHTPRLQ